MSNLKGEQIALIITAIVGLASAIGVALINKKPKPQTQVDEYGFFYDQYQILYKSVLKDAEKLRIKKESLRLQIKKLETQVTDLEKTIELYEKELEEVNVQLEYWMDEAKIAYKIIDKEI